MTPPRLALVADNALAADHARGLRKRLLARAAVATATMAALLAGLGLFDADDASQQPLLPTSSAGSAPTHAPVVAVPDASPTPAPGGESPAPADGVAVGSIGGASAPLVAAPASPDAGPVAAVPAVAAEPDASHPLPGATADAAPVPGATPSAMPDALGPGLAPSATSEPQDAREQAALASPPSSKAGYREAATADPAALAAGYVVQIGVFGAAANAESLRSELAAQGYPANVQSRVVLGPFADRKAAKAAEEKLRRERKLVGIIVAPRKP